MSTPSPFRTRTLSAAAARELLVRKNMGRLAYLDDPRIEVRPVGYVFSDDWIFGRMAIGQKVEALLRHRWVTFQVDEVLDHWSWRSVVLHGALHFLDGAGGAVAKEARNRALEALQSAIPGFGGPDDPGSFRDLFFGIEVQEIEGTEGYLEEA